MLTTWRSLVLGVGFCLCILGGAVRLAQAETQPVTISYSRFLADLSHGRVAEAVIAEASLRTRYHDGTIGVVTLPPGSGYLPNRLVQHGVTVRFATPDASSFAGILIRLMPPLLVLMVIIYMSRREADQGSRGVLSVEQSPAQIYRPGSAPVTMGDVAGMDEVKEELQEVIDFLRDPNRYRSLGARIPRGILLWGPPGTGKTLLARAVAGEAGVVFLSIAGSEFVELYAGVGASRVRSVFERARKFAPCILFVDEIDAVAKQRQGGSGGGLEERDQTLNQLLVEMDGFTPSEGVIVMAATNRIDVLDSAVLRPGRFDRQIVVDPPDRAGRLAILRVHSRGKPLGRDVDLERIAAVTTGFTGADLANLLNEAALLAARSHAPWIDMADLLQAYERVVTGGPARRRQSSPEALRRIAYHEAGHALVGRRLEGPGRIVKVSIVPRGRAMGYVMQEPGEDQHLHSRRELLNRLAGLLAGRAAEELALGEGSSGAADDLERATAIARSMVAEWGMSPAIGPVRTAGPASEAAPACEATQRRVDQAVQQLVTEGYRRAQAILAAERESLERLANLLLERESLDGTQVERLLEPAPNSAVAVAGPPHGEIAITGD